MTATQPTLEQLTLKAREHIAATLPDPYRAETAVMFLLDTDGRVHELSQYANVYDGLKEITAVDILDNHVAVGLFTVGWAAPLSTERPLPDDPAPSEHPDRVRVQLCAAINRELRIVSVVQMQDKDEPLVEDSGEGQLADALTVTMVMLLRARAKRSVDA